MGGAENMCAIRLNSTRRASACGESDSPEFLEMNRTFRDSKTPRLQQAPTTESGIDIRPREMTARGSELRKVHRTARINGGKRNT
jgi:hypothetical protein